MRLCACEWQVELPRLARRPLDGAARRVGTARIRGRLLIYWRDRRGVSSVVLSIDMSATLRWSVAWIDGGRDVEADLPAWQLAEDDVARLLESKGYQIVGRSRTSKGHEYIAVRETRTMVQVKSQALQPARSERSRRDFGNGGAPNRQVTVYVDTHGPRPWPMLAVPSRWMDDCSRIRTRRYVELGPGRKLSWSGAQADGLRGCTPANRHSAMSTSAPPGQLQQTFEWMTARRSLYLYLPP